MEKYRQFADNSTGVNPFIPIWGQSKTPFLKRIMNLPIFICRIILLFLSMIMFILFIFFTECLYFDHLKIIFFSIFINGLSRVILFILGCFWISEFTEKSSLYDSESMNNIKKGKKLIFSNRQSFCDILLYSSILGNPEYMFVTKSEVILISNSFSALLFSMGFKINYGVNSFLEKNKYIINTNIRPLVIFMEEANTNGSCILKWNNFDKIPDNIEMRKSFFDNTELFVISYKLGSNYGPQFTTGNILIHLINMLYNISYFSIHLKILTNQYLKTCIDSENFCKKNKNSFLKSYQTRKIDEYLTAIQAIQGKTTNLPIVNNGIDQAENFIEYWKKTNKRKIL